MMYQPVTGTRYTADADGYFEAEVVHAKDLMRAGCERA